MVHEGVDNGGAGIRGAGPDHLHGSASIGGRRGVGRPAGAGSPGIADTTDATASGIIVRALRRTHHLDTHGRGTKYKKTRIKCHKNLNHNNNNSIFSSSRRPVDRTTSVRRHHFGSWAVGLSVCRPNLWLRSGWFWLSVRLLSSWYVCCQLSRGS